MNVGPPILPDSTSLISRNLLPKPRSSPSEFCCNTCIGQRCVQLQEIHPPTSSLAHSKPSSYN